MTDIKRNPMPLEYPLRLAAIVSGMLEPYHVTEIPEAMKYWALVEQEIAKHIFNSALPDTTVAKMAQARSQWIAIFLAKYKERSGHDYFNIGPAEAKSINRFLDIMQKRGGYFTNEDFLNWVFDVFLEAHPERTFTISTLTSNYTIDSFFLANKDLEEQKKRDAIIGAERMAWLGRLRTLRQKFRGTAHGPAVEELYDRTCVKRTIPFGQLKQAITKFEAIKE